MLQTSFGIIQENDASPPASSCSSQRPQWNPHVASANETASSSSTFFGDGDGGDVPDANLRPLPTTGGRGLPRSAGVQVMATPAGFSTASSLAAPPLVYNHRGELQELPTTSSAAASPNHSRSSRSMMLSSTSVSNGDQKCHDDDVVPTRPPPSLPTTSTAGKLPNGPAAVPNTRPRVSKSGTALVPPEPVNPTTGKRNILIGPDMWIVVTPEEKLRFVEIEQPSSHTIGRGTVLGTDGDYLVWHERGKRYAQRLTPADYKSLVTIVPAKCKHCGAILPRDEADAHVSSHKRGGGIETGTTVGDEQYGTSCGDTALLMRLVRVRLLGSGAQGEVWLCRDGDAPTTLPSSSSISATISQLYVQKDMRCTDEKDAVLRYQQSVRLMAISHVHIITYLAVQRHPRDPMVTVLMPYYSEGDLAGLIRNQRDRFEEQYILSLLLQMATALHFLHTRSPASIIHGDIKPENVLLFNRHQQIILMDLDASKELSGHHASTLVQVGTTAWMAPEAIHEQHGTTKSDVWSMGLIAYVLCVLPDFPMLHCESTGSNELINSTSWAMQELLRRIGGKVMARSYSKELAVLITRMLHHNSNRRPSAGELIEQITNIMTSQLVVAGENSGATGM